MNFILDILFPKKCVGCGKLGTFFCKICISGILQKNLICPKCKRLAIGGKTHPICRRKYGLDGLWSLGIYQGSFQEAIKQLKYGKVKGLAVTLADITIEYWAKFQPFVLDQIKKSRGVGWVVIPVPLFWWRANKRGFNQASLIGQILSNRLGLDYCDALKRTRHTKPQVKLKGKERCQNIRGAFAVLKAYTQLSQKGCVNPKQYVLLIDDVWTTGSTLRECCYVLKKAGAKKVWVITLAR
ncbi:ComF family protein [Patescibacteria group bacterium]|nr:ComF family protein [Patescibacteria group bacterium]